MEFLKAYWPYLATIAFGIAVFTFLMSGEGTNTFHEGKPGPTGTVQGGKK